MKKVARKVAYFCIKPVLLRTVIFISFCVFIGTFLGCGRGKERLIEEKVAERVAEFRKKRSAECRVALLEEAEKTVDSLLLHEALQEVTDSLARRLPF